MKTVMILGGTKGVGKEILKSCLAKDYNVAFCGRSVEEGDELMKSLQADDKLYFHQVDLNTTDEVENFVNNTIEKFSQIDALVLYAGVTPVASLTETEEDVYDTVFNINLKTPYFVIKHVMKHMKKAGQGSIIFFGSAHMDYGQKDRTAYALTKGTLYTLSTHIAHHYAEYGIRSNYVVMGWTSTEGELELRKEEGISADELKRKAAEELPMGRMLNPKDPVPAVMHFISDDSAMTTGSIMRITAGEFI
ncbi:SDR family NAD(P)-dependent oxidoreductase [Flavicella marina]|uniref:SDR family NAD(P)-dependent oxidoreductase n=1 Tax=Flavicella marina TaxID=1475951 RepID=UPI00186AE2DA|nr:SDR family oxidoreductase [Flavicella marina]